MAAKVLKENVAYFSYGYIKDVNELVPQHAAHLLYVPCHGDAGRVLHPLLHRGSRFAYKKDLSQMRWMHWVAMLTIPLGYLAGRQVGWLPNADVSRGPFRICCPQVPPFPNWMSAPCRPFFIFLVLFTVMLIAEVGIMLKAIRKGPEKNFLINHNL